MIRIFKTGLSSSSDSPEVLTAELGQQTSPGRRGFDPKSSGHRSPGGGASILANKRLTLPFLAFVAVLAAGLLFLLPGGHLQAQEAMTELDYAENGTDPVATYTGIDPEERLVYWSLLEDHAGVTVGDNPLTVTDVVDHEDFTISSDGVLSFKLPPDFETPEGAALLTAAIADKTNTYNIVVVASDDAPGADGTADSVSNPAYHKVTVMVTDVDEDGSISLSAQQPQVSVALTATLTDPDARSTTARPIANETWKWEQSSEMDGPWTLIPGAGAGDTDASGTDEAYDNYMPAKDIVGMYLRATVTYTDKHGDDKTAMATSAHMVRAVPSGTNSDPEFPDSDDGYDRDVNENSAPGTPVGKPVKASDTPGETLTYGLRGTDAGNYTIDAATGQLRVGARGLDDADTTAGTEPTDSVTVWAMDPSSGPLEATPGDADDDGRDDVTVTITIKNVNEAPRVSGGPTSIKHPENNTTIDLDSENQGDQQPTYTATDTESTETNDACDNTVQGSICALSLEGPDGADFTIGDGTGGTAFGQLSFKNVPDFENPADADMDNVYMVTVKVTDNGVTNKNKMSATRDVMITVANANEPGTITLSSVQPKIGRPFTASLTDPDSVTSTNTDGSIETGVTWQWWKSMEDNVGTVPEFLDSDGSPNTDSDGWEKIADTKSDTYKPVRDDEGRWLTAMATYTDRLGPGKTMHKSSNNAVAANTDNVPPEFKEGGDKPVMQATRYIVESADADVVVNPDGTTNSTDATAPDMVMATDPNTGDLLTYTLGGPDKDSFKIAPATGQISVGADTKLDYESNKKTYMVTVTATDPSRAMTTIDVTIMVVDVNEAPEFTAPSEGDVERTVQENTGSLSIYTFRATDPERRKVYWSLDDDNTDSPDMDRFTISDNGMLSLKDSPNYEDDAVLGSDRQYTVVVVASDDAPGAGITDEDPIMSSMKTVTVTVTDVEEPGTITLAPKYPHVGNAVTATLTDGDGTPSSIDWEWTVSSGTPASAADSATYNPGADDSNKTLRVKATYAEDGDDKVVGPVSAGTVREAPDPANSNPEFDPSTANRTVPENARVGTSLGAAIRATDANNDSLTYTVDNANFRVSSSGQLSTAAMLDHEDDGDSGTTADGATQDVTIRATDPWGGTITAAVTVTVEDVNEAPMINAGPTRKDHAENTMVDTLIGDYGATDVDDGDTAALTWSLEGDDATKFSIVEADGMLTFKESPNFENPTDRNKDNVYKVTVVVSDDGTPKLTDKWQVEVTVTDVGENGEVTLSAVQPKTGIDLMASLTDPDSVTSTNTDGSIETGVTWQWWKSMEDDVGTVPEFLDSDGSPNTDSDGWEKIADTKSDTYKPVRDDEGRWLTAMATYTDRRGPGNTMYKSSNNAVIVNNDNVAPHV